MICACKSCVDSIVAVMRRARTSMMAGVACFLYLFVILLILDTYIVLGKNKNFSMSEDSGLYSLNLDT